MTVSGEVAGRTGTRPDGPAGGRRAATGATVAAACLFGTTGLAASLAPDDAGATSVGLGRVVLAGLCSALLAGWSARRTSRVVPRSGVRPSARPRARVVALGALGVLGYQPFFFAGVERNGAAVGALVALGTAPVVTGLLEVLLGRQRPGARWVWTTALAVVGVALVGGVADGAGTSSVDPVGVLASVSAGTCYAVYALAAARLIADGASVTTTMGWLFALAGLVALPWWWHGDRSWLGELSGLVAWLWLGIGATTLAYLLLGVGLARLRTSTVATLTLAEPVTATVLGVLVLSERLTPAALVGVLLLGVGLAALARSEVSGPADDDLAAGAGAAGGRRQWWRSLLRR